MTADDYEAPMNRIADKRHLIHSDAHRAPLQCFALASDAHRAPLQCFALASDAHRAPLQCFALAAWRWLVRLVVVMAVLAPLVSARASWFIRNWQSDEGLPDNSVIGISQSPDGFLWVATKKGLTRFDGVRFRPWPVTADGFQAGGCKAVLADRRGRIWVAKDQGIVVCVDQGRTTTVVGTEHAAGDVGGRLMVEDAEGAVWVSYCGGEVLRIEDGRVRSFAVADGLPAGDLCRLAVDGMGQLWFARGDRVGVYRDDKFRPLRELPARIITGCLAGGIWSYKDGQVWSFTEDGAPVKLGALPADTPLVTPTAFYEDHDGFLWLGTREAGLFRFDHAGVPTAIMAQQTIFTITDDSDCIWNETGADSGISVSAVLRPRATGAAWGSILGGNKLASYPAGLGMGQWAAGDSAIRSGFVDILTFSGLAPTHSYNLCLVTGTGQAKFQYLAQTAHVISIGSTMDWLRNDQYGLLTDCIPNASGEITIQETIPGDWAGLCGFQNFRGSYLERFWAGCPGHVARASCPPPSVGQGV